jgi:hypothetical protein
MKKLELAGQKFGRLTVRSPAPNTPAGKARWVCKCECGNERTVAAGSLVFGRQMSCGCLRIERLRKTLFLPNGEGAVGDLYRSYVFKARHRKLPFSLTRDDFRDLIHKNCHYCGFAPYRIKKTKSGSTTTYNGIDRADNKLGYIAGNVLPCCSECNFAKGRHFPTSEAFLKWLDRFKYQG